MMEFSYDGQTWKVFGVEPVVHGMNTIYHKRMLLLYGCMFMQLNIMPTLLCERLQIWLW